MSPSSRASIPPYSRPPSSSRPGAASTAQVLWHRYLIAGAVPGAFLSIASFLSLVDQPDFAWQPVMLSAIFSIVLSALLVGSLGAAAFALASWVPRLRGRATRLAAFVSASVVLLYVVVRGIAEAFRLSSGAPLNLGTAEFIIAGLGHLFLPVLAEYALVASVITLATLGLGSIAYYYLKRPVDGLEGAARGLFARSLGSAAVFVLLMSAFLTPGVCQEAGLDKTAELSFASSVAARAEEELRMAEEEKKRGVVVPHGPRLSSGQLWEQAVARMEGPRPNFVLIMMESVGTNHLGYYGYERPTTQNLDRIAQRSVRFLNARTTASHSNYAQMAVLSSLFPRRYSGLDTYKRLDYPRVLWHDFLSVLGYTTATHSSQDETWQGMIRFQTTKTPNEFHHAKTYEGQKVRMGSESIVPDEVTAKRAIQWMEGAEGPFGIYVNLQSTHFPYRVPPGVNQPYQPTRPTKGKFHYLGYPKSDIPIVENRFDNALTYVDEQIGRIYDYLERSGKLENTIFIVTSDHGELFGEHDMVTHGRSLAEEEVRVPLLIHYPAKLAGVDDMRAVSTLDVLPTVASLLEIPTHPSFQGHSLLSKDGQLPPVFMNIQSMKSQDAVVCGNYKFVHKRNEQENALYDWTRDPSEVLDLSEKLPSVAEQLRVLLSAQMRTQQGYHSPRELGAREQFYAPRLATCPEFSAETASLERAATRSAN